MASDLVGLLDLREVTGAGQGHVPIGDELGWRGLAMPRMQQRYGSVVASIVLGFKSKPVV